MGKLVSCCPSEGGSFRAEIQGNQLASFVRPRNSKCVWSISTGYLIERQHVSADLPTRPDNTVILPNSPGTQPKSISIAFWCLSGVATFQFNLSESPHGHIELEFC